MAEQTATTTQGLVPYINPSDAAAAAEFYKKAFAATDVVPMLADDGKRYMHCSMTINGSQLYMSDSFPEYGVPFVPPQGFNLNLNVDNAQFWWDRAVWGDIYGQLKDPYGITWAIGSTPEA